MLSSLYSLKLFKYFFAFINPMNGCRKLNKPRLCRMRNCLYIHISQGPWKMAPNNNDCLTLAEVVFPTFTPKNTSQQLLQLVFFLNLPTPDDPHKIIEGQTSCSINRFSIPPWPTKSSCPIKSLNF